MRSQEDAHLAFDDVVIDFAGQRLWRGGVERSLEPKAFAVLALLAGAPGRVFARDDILDAVWGHRHVTPGVLNRIVTLLRHALGEDAQHPRRLHTVHGTGYRFDLPADAEPADASPERRTQADRRSSAPASAVAQAPPRSRRDWRWLAAVLLLACVALALWRVLAPSSPPTAPLATAPEKTPTLIVMPLKPLGEAGSRDLAAGLGEELIGMLARIDGLRVIARESTVIATAESTDLDRLEQRLRITHALEGSLQQAGQKLRIRLRLVEAGSGRALWTRDFDRDASEVLALQREIAQAVATSLALEMGLPVGVEARSGDAQFLRRYLAARAALFREPSVSATTAETAESEFRALIRERPDDARSRAGLLVALHARAYRRLELADALRAEALQEAAVVQRLDPSLPESWFIQGAAACRRNDWETCVPLLEKARALAPSNSGAIGGMFYGYTLTQLGYLDRAERLQREILAVDPISPERSFALGRVLDTLGRHEEARLQFDPDDSFHKYGRWFNAVWRRDYAEALRIAERDFDRDAELDSSGVWLKPAFVASSRALLDPSAWPQASIEIEQSERKTGRMNFNRVLMPDAPAHAADLIAGLDRARKRAYSTWDLLLWTQELAYLRRDPAFQNYLRDNGILDYWRRHGFPPQCHPQGDGAACG